MKTIVIIFALIFLTINDSFSQDSLQVAPDVIAEAITNKIDREILLTPVQREEVYQLLLERSKEYDQIEKNHKSDKSKIKAEKIKTNEKSHIRFEKAITKEQFEKYEEQKVKDKEQAKALKGNEPYYLSEEDEELDF